MRFDIWRLERGVRIDYGLSKTSLASLLDSGSMGAQTSHNAPSTKASDTAPAKKPDKPQPKHQESPTTQAHIDSASAQRETFGLEILEKMSDREYQVFLRASEGLSEVEKMAAAQALYIFTESTQKQIQDPAKSHHENPSTHTPQNLSKRPTTPKNPYFNARDSFITRYVALYHGAQEMDILG